MEKNMKYLYIMDSHLLALPDLLFPGKDQESKILNITVLEMRKCVGRHSKSCLIMEERLSPISQKISVLMEQSRGNIETTDGNRSMLLILMMYRG
jgi:hypothetical protein